jgi:hemoglobin-like flavoprotein
VSPLALAVFEASLKRCEARADFLDVFYEKFLASSREVAEKFAGTDFARQKEALRASFQHLVLVARDPKQGPDPYLEDVAVRHGAGRLAIGAHLYDLWLDSLLETVRACDPECFPEVEAAWEEVMMVGIHYLCANYDGRHGR